jgi:hypothetical protein
MRISSSIVAVVFCAASIGVAHAQQSAATSITAPRGTTVVKKAPTGMSFAYDAAHGQISATGMQLSSSVVKSNSVSPTVGQIYVTINIAIDSRFESGTTYHCSVYAIGGIIDLDTGTVDGGVETANTFATVTSARTASCTLAIPYSWTLPNDGGADSGLILAFGVGAINPHSEVERSTLQVDGIENLPASGAVGKYVFNVAL